MDNLTQQVYKIFPLDLEVIKEVKSEEDLFLLLSDHVQELIDTDFSKLINTLYRIDVSEIKIKKALDLSDPKDANRVIAKLIIERENKKLSREKPIKTESPTINYCQALVQST